MPHIKCADPHGNSSFSYCPSYPAAIAFSAFFGMIFLAHLTLAIHYRKRFCWVITMGALWETGGFIFRVFNIIHPTSDSLATASQLLILLSPLWINAFAYMILGRMAYYWIPDKKVWKIKARSLSKWFVWLDICSFFVQGIGGSMTSSTDTSTKNLGIHIYMGGIAVQEFFIVMFLLLTIKFHKEVQVIGKQKQTSWRPILYVLYISLAMISIRIIYRLVEFSSGFWAYIPTHEWFFYVFEATPMILAMMSFIAVHPGGIFIGEESEFSKLQVTKGGRRWWCCGRRSRRKVDMDFEMNRCESPEHEQIIDHESN